MRSFCKTWIAALLGLNFLLFTVSIHNLRRLTSQMHPISCKNYQKMKSSFAKMILLLIFNLSWIFVLAQTNVEFVVTDLPPLNNRKVGLRGDTSPMSWDKSIPLEKKGDSYQVKLEFPDATKRIEYKFVLFGNKNNPTWEGIQNRSLELNNEDLVSTQKWNVDQLIDIKSLPLLQPDQLMEDFKLLETMVLDIHPGTYRYNDKASIQMALAELKSKFQNPMTYGQAYLAMSKVTAQIKCGHTQVGFYNQKPTINSIIHRQKDKLPFSFTWVDDQMIILRNASESEALKRSTEVISINGVKAADIQQSMFPYIASDGATDRSRIALMGVEGHGFDFYAFDVFFPLLFPFEEEMLELEIKGYDESTVQKVTVSTLTREERAKILIERYPDFPKNNDDLWKFEITEDKIGILTLNSFTLYGLGALTLDYKAVLADIFKQLKTEKIENLIVDIRKNGGGNDEIKHELFTYFNIDKKLPSLERVGKSRYLKFPESLKQYVKTWGDNPWYYDMKPDEVDEENGYYIFKDNFSGRLKKRKSNAFNGSIYLLTSPINASLTFYLAADFQKRKLGTIIGQETGGNMQDINGGQILFLYLPNSGIEVNFPVVGGFTIKNQPNRGVLPDIPTQTAIQDIYQNRDVEMETTINLIQTRKGE